MRILVTGSRDWDDQQAIFEALSDIDEASSGPITLVHGGARGADTVAEEFAHAAGWSIERHLADWKNLGKRAGFVRNAEMAELGADLCLAFIKNNSRGASMMANLADQVGIPVREFRA